MVKVRGAFLAQWRRDPGPAQAPGGGTGGAQHGCGPGPCAAGIATGGAGGGRRFSASGRCPCAPPRRRRQGRGAARGRDWERSA